MQGPLLTPERTLGSCLIKIAQGCRAGRENGWEQLRRERNPLILLSHRGSVAVGTVQDEARGRDVTHGGSGRRGLATGNGGRRTEWTR